ncbi:Ran-binding protein 1 b [Tripterygium wilfordii]|uniref:Ran-binding protein 1 b n=1 Tax=Tripterygium wilfordii TaxID=458696 RepID=A0A7J7DYT8_TRIWF|nr:Ran-binding protein 1 b [Tripterygium wilfordii]
MERSASLCANPRLSRSVPIILVRYFSFLTYSWYTFCFLGLSIWLMCFGFAVLPNMTVQEHAGSEKSCVWHATDFADGELKKELFCIRFGSIENCKTFMETFQEVAESQKKNEENEDATATAGLLEKLSVEGKKNEDKKGKEAPAAASEEKETESIAPKDEKDTETEPAKKD